LCFYRGCCFNNQNKNKAVRFINLNHLVMEEDLAGVLNEVSSEVVAFNPGMVVVDSFRNMVRKGSTRESELQTFVQRLALLLTGWEATTFLIGEYSEEEMSENPVFTVADGLFRLTQNVERNSVVRKLQIIKMRGQYSVPGLQTIRITGDGLQAFSRTLGLGGKRMKSANKRRLSIGIPELDKTEEFWKAIACWCPDLRGRENRRWPPNFSPKASVTANRESRQSSKNAP
jgi:circadian clock protein KaiC